MEICTKPQCGVTSYLLEWSLIKTKQKMIIIIQYVEKLEQCILLVGIQNSKVVMENSMKFPPKLKIELPCDPETTLMGIYPK